MGHLQHHKEVTDQMDMVIKYARQTSHLNIEKYSKLFDNERILCTVRAFFAAGTSQDITCTARTLFEIIQLDYNYRILSIT